MQKSSANCPKTFEESISLKTHKQINEDMDTEEFCSFVVVFPVKPLAVNIAEIERIPQHTFCWFGGNAMGEGGQKLAVCMSRYSFI